ncbi:MAG: ABC transporter ATP-binding protein/permease [Coprobacillus sp.]|nr:ABC transporter ATP-binding protein/permease [Coprobacillus sp.]MDY4144705.1 ABC transporter ATP-binding protein [Bacilli bacterium]
MIKRFIKYYKPHRKLLFVDLLFACLISIIDLVFPMVTKNVLKECETNQNLQFLRTILIIGLVLLIFYIIRFILSYFIGYYGHVMGIRLETDMRSDLFKKYQELDYQYFDDKKTGELMSNLTTHLHDVSEMSHHAPEDIFISVIMLVGSFVYLFFFANPYLTLIVFSFLSILIIYSITRRKKMMKAFRNARNAQSELSSRVESSISGIRLTKAFNNMDYEKQRFEQINTLYKDARSGVFKEIGLFGSGNDFFINLTNLALLVFGTIFVIKGWNVTYIDLTTYFLYINFLIKPISRLTNSMEQIQQGFSGIEKFYNIMDEEIKIKNDYGIIKNNFEGDIEFKDVCFSYSHKKEKDVLTNFNLHIETGEKIALVGETGVGKTTISKLIPRFYDVDEGEILVDGINVKDYNLDNLRNAIGHVEQDVFVFYGTIKENILFGKPQATMDEIISAAKKAQIHDFIMTLPKGYDTLTGERGVKLSGGQKQRIAIARLFLKNPKILILDEATSSLDNITEKQIQQSFDELSQGKTTIIIAHRLSTIKNADEIIVISKEGIIERGKHDELITKNGYYAKLYNSISETY